MYLIVGLGNPEEEYKRTRHNMGFDVVNEIASRYMVSLERKKFDAIYGEAIIEGQKVMLIKPQTYMNLSGVAVKQFVDFYKIPMEQVIVIYDDMDIEKGTMKIRKKGGAGSHNGMKSVISQMGSEGFPRIRIGIGAPLHPHDRMNYVLEKLSKEEYTILEQGIQKASMAIIDMLKSGIDHAMNQYNETIRKETR